MNLLSSLEQVTVVSSISMEFLDCINDDILGVTDSSQNNITHNIISLSSYKDEILQCLHLNLISSFNITF